MQALPTILTSCLSLLLSLVCACGTTGGLTRGANQSGDDAVELRFTDSISGQTLGIINDSWLKVNGYQGDTSGDRRTNFYSRKTVKAQAGFKVAEDEVMSGILEAFELSGYSDHARQGTPIGDLRQSLVVSRAGATSYVFSDKGMPLDQHKAFIEIVKSFTAVYNHLPQFQAVEGNIGFSSQ